MVCDGLTAPPRPESTKPAFRFRILPFLAVLVLVSLFCFRETGGFHRVFRDNFLSRDVFGGRKIKSFTVTIASGAGATRPTLGAAALNLNETTPVWGSYLPTDGFVGVLTSSNFPIDFDRLSIPVAGYPSSAGNRLELEWMDPGPRSDAPVVFSGADPGESVQLWTIDTRAYRGRTARLKLVDQRDQLQGWLAIGEPRAVDGGGDVLLVERPRNRTYVVFFATAGVIACFLWIPGAMYAAWRPQSRFSSVAYRPLFGLLSLVLLGLSVWVFHQGGNANFARFYIAAHLVPALWLGLRRDVVVETPVSAEGRLTLVCYGTLCLGILVFSTIPLPVAEEALPFTAAQSRAVLTSPDHWIPYATAAYMFSGRDGKKDSDLYFSTDWSIASRGPVAPLAIVALFNLFGAKPPDPLGLIGGGYPAASEYFFIARIFGVMTNAFVVVVIPLLLRRLGVTRKATIAAALAWACLAPVTWIETAYVWPKLLAVYFLFLAAADILAEEYDGSAGFWAAFAWAAHPLGALFWPGLAALMIGRQTSRSIKPCTISFARFGAGAAIVVLPWFLYKVWLGRPDVFLRYPLGDGRGFLSALSWKSWWVARWRNAWYTLMPTAFYFSDRSKELGGVKMGGAIRWALQYSKTLPGNIGFVMLVPAYRAVARTLPAKPQRLKWSFIVLPLLVMLLYWGYSDDGFGRNCLQPASLGLIVVTMGSITTTPRWLPVALGLLGCENLFFLGLNFFAARTFALEQLTGETVAPLVGCAVLATVPLLFWYRCEQQKE
jgi:hypothetical protein